jgi:hypothetical protein
LWSGVKRWALGVAALGAAALGVLELVLRLLHVDNVMLYRKDAATGYVPAPSQQGRFIGKVRFVFDDQGFGVAAPYDPRPDDVILIGDSIVNGGLQIDQPQRLGPQLQVASGRRVWPLGAFSWALGNELAALDRLPGHDRVSAIVFVTNYDDFRTPSVWHDDVDHPDHRPRLASLFLLRKLLRPDTDRNTFNDAPSWQPGLRRLLAGPHPRIIFALHHVQDDQPKPGDPLSRFRAYLQGYGAEVCDLQGVLRPDDYRDYLHPTASGDARMARRIADCLVASPGTNR